MKTLPVILAVLLCSCQTTLYDRQTGKPIARFTENAQETLYQDGSTYFHELGMDHSTPTTVATNGADKIVGTVAGAVVSSLALHGAVPAAARYLAPAAPIGQSAVHHRAATPTPTPAQLHMLLHR